MSASLREAIEANFGIGPVPGEQELVRFDGFDDPDKKHSLELFLGKSVGDVIRAMPDPVGGFASLSAIEDLIVMEPRGYHYYLAPYLLEILRNEADGTPDLELTGPVSFAIREILRIRGGKAFSESQRSVLSRWVDCIADGSHRWDDDDAFADSLQEDLDWLKTALAVA